MDPNVIRVLMGLGAVLFVFIMFQLFSPGISHNKQVLVDADALAARNEYEAALRYAQQNGDPSGSDWHRLEEKIAQWKSIVLQKPDDLRDAEANAWLRTNVINVTTTTTFRPMDRLPEDVVAERLREFLGKYGDTWPGRMLKASDPDSGEKVEPWFTLRRILRENASGGADVGALLRTAEGDARSKASGRSFGEAIRVYTQLKQEQQLLLKPEVYSDLRRRADAAIAELQQEARRAYDDELSEIRLMITLGETQKAKSRLEVIIQTYGVADLVRQAQLELDNLP
jgi:hypothetical protein